MHKKTENYYDADHLLEGLVLNHLWGPMNRTSDNPLMALIDTSDFGKKPTAEGLQKVFSDGVKEAREMSVTDEEIEDCLRLNLRTYNFNDESFPIKEWMSDA